MDLSMACVIHGCFLCLYLFGFDICSGMCLSSKLINLLINKVYGPLVDCLKNAPTIGKNMFTEFVTDIIEEASKPLSYVIIKKKCTHSQTDHQRI